MISYNPFWNTLKNSPETTYTLINKHHISSATIDKLRKNKPMTTTTLNDLCCILNCNLSHNKILVAGSPTINKAHQTFPFDMPYINNPQNLIRPYCNLQQRIIYLLWHLIFKLICHNQYICLLMSLLFFKRFLLCITIRHPITSSCPYGRNAP